MSAWVMRLVMAAATVGFVAAVWFAGPMIALAERRPLEAAWARLALIAAALALVGGIEAVRLARRGKAERRLEAAATAADRNPEGLNARLAAAVEALKRASGRRNVLYETPWYILIGPRGAGKTTAVVRSGLKLPAADGAVAIAGSGGTRHCDWWLADDAVLIDTSGRYTTQGADAPADRNNWLAFLALLRRTRAKAPINGAIVALSVEDLLRLDDGGLAAHAAAIRARLGELASELGIDFPVYVLFTKADLIAGFAEFFDGLEGERRSGAWGAALPPDLAPGETANRLAAGFDAMAERLSADTADRLEAAPDAAARAAIFGFPAQFAALKPRVTTFLRAAAETRAGPGARLRGFFFCSGIQEGRSIDAILGLVRRAPVEAEARGSFFLRDLFTKVIFAEAGWVARGSAAGRRQALLRRAGIAAVVLLSAALLGAWGLSFSRNRALIADTRALLAENRAEADALLRAEAVSDVDLENVLGVLGTLRALPVGFDGRDRATPLGETFGLGQRDRLRSAADTAYRRALERLFRSRLILQLEHTIEAEMGDPIELYEPLKVYLMLGGAAPGSDDELIVAWAKRDWEQNRYPGAANRAGRAELEAHLRAMLALDDRHEPAIPLNRPLVETAQRSLARMDMADRALALIRSAAPGAGLEDFSLVARAGPQSPAVFETTDGRSLNGLGVPGLYTDAGFRDFFLPQLATVAQRLIDEQWVLGAGGERVGVEEQLKRLGPQLLDRYAEEFAAAWTDMLGKVKLRPLSADKPAYAALAVAASPESPLLRLVEAVAEETGLTREAEVLGGDAGAAEGLARIGIAPSSRKSQNRAGGAVAGTGGALPGAAVEARFRPFRMLVAGEPGGRPVDALIRNLSDIRESLVLSADAEGPERAGASLQLQVLNLRTNASRLPEPLAGMVRTAADAFEGDVAEASLAQLNAALAETVGDPCREAVADAYPFSRNGGREVPLADFARLFAPNGEIDRFFAQNLAPLADLGGRDWRWKEASRLGRELSAETLRAFQRAAAIRDAFFPRGGGAPEVALTITPLSLHGDADMALLDVNGQLVQGTQAGSAPATLRWPGGGAAGSVDLSLTPEIPGRASSVRFEGPWALLRLVDSGTVSRNGEEVQLRLVIGGRDVAFAIRSDGSLNPLALPALGEFSCPTGL